MGESQKPLFEPDFNRTVKVLATDERLTSDAGFLLLREADHTLGLTESLADALFDPRDERRIRYKLVELLRERVYALATGYEAQDDLDRLAHDPALRTAVWDRRGEEGLRERLASQPTHSRLVDMLAHCEGNRDVLRNALVDWTHRHLRAGGRDRAVRHGTVDVDSFPLEVHGRQEGASYNGYYKADMYHPLVASFSVSGDYDSTRTGSRLGNGFVHAALRMGHVNTAKDALKFIDEVVQKTRPLAQVLDLRLDAGFVYGEILDYLTEENVHFVGRLKANAVLHRLADPHLGRPPGRPPREGYERVVELGNRKLGDWRHEQRLILVVTDRPDPVTGQLNLLPDYFFLAAGWSEDDMSAEDVLDHYRRRGTFEDRLGEFVNAVGRHLSSPDALDNEATFLLSLLAFNLASCLRNELEAAADGAWDLGRFQNYVLKAGGRITKGARRLYIRVARPVIPFWEILFRRISSWRLPDRWPSPRGATGQSWVPPPKHSNLHEVLRW